jgi:hypothetical protein
MTEIHTNKLARLQAAGWKVGNAKDFLQLSEEETRLVELKLSLAGAVKKFRLKRKLSQVDPPCARNPDHASPKSKLLIRPFRWI